MYILVGRENPSDYKYHRLTTPALFSLNHRRPHCPTSLYPFSSFSFLHIICRHNGPLRSFRSRGACLLNTRCWPDHTCTCRPDIPCNSTHRYPLPIHRFGGHSLQSISAFFLLVPLRCLAGAGHHRDVCPRDTDRLQSVQLEYPEPGFNVPDVARQ